VSAKIPRELRIALFERGPIDPRHVPPNKPGEGGFEFAVDDCDRLFFEHFDLFARAINGIYTPDRSWDGGPWRLQELRDTSIRRSDVDDYPVHGRRYEVFYNQACLGTVEISADPTNYTSEKPTVFTSVALEHVRLLPFDDVYGFLVTIAAKVSGGGADEYAKAQIALHRALISAVWQIDQDERSDGGTVDLHFHGSAATYLQYRQAVREHSPRR
jgi:hypothetical protein